MSEEIEKIEPEGLSNEDLAAEVELETEAAEQSSDDSLSVDQTESVEDLSEAYSNAVSDLDKDDEESDSDQNEPEAQDQGELSDEESDDTEDSPVAEDMPDDQKSSEDSDTQDETGEQQEPDLADSEAGEAVETDAELEDDDDDAEDEEQVDAESDIEADPGEISTCSVIEAILFAADEPVNARKLVEIINAGGVKEVKQHIKSLNKKYKKMDCAFRVEELAGGYQLLTLSAYKPWLSKLIKVRSESKLTAAAMETLSIIAYKQPLMRVEIENIRGVAAGEMIRQLIEKGLVKIVGRAEELGRPLLYGTTQKFLDIFGLGSLKDLPQPEDQKK